MGFIFIDEERAYSFDSIVDKIELQATEIRFPESIIKCSHEKHRRT
jgi:hypothetical protein